MAILWAILTCGIYTYYWSYMTGKKMGEIDGSGSGAGHSTDLVADELNGETLNDAIYQRTSYIEEKYNVHFNLMWCGETSVGLTGSAISSSGAILPIWS